MHPLPCEEKALGDVALIDADLVEPMAEQLRCKYTNPQVCVLALVHEEPQMRLCIDWTTAQEKRSKIDRCGRTTPPARAERRPTG